MTRDLPLVLALDGGGTKSELALADREGEVVFFARGRSTSLMDSPDWRQQLSELFSSASHLRQRVVHSVLGAPGYGEVRRIDAELDSALALLVAGPSNIVNDVELALDGAFLDRAGIVVLAGTGSMAMARHAEGEIVRVGGWSSIFGDEGSAYWIGREALSYASRAIDGRIGGIDFALGLFRLLKLNASDPIDALVGWCRAGADTRTAVAGIARSVDTLAAGGDPTAKAILRRAADHLSAHIHSVQRRLHMPGPLPWSFAGSVFESRTVLHELIARHGEPEQPELVPIAGGLWRAARHARWNTDAAWVGRLRNSLRRQCEARAGLDLG